MAGHAASPQQGAAGRAAEFKALFQREYSNVSRFLLRLGVPQNELADLVQDVFVTVHHHFAERESGLPLRPWLYAIAVQAARRSFRRRAVLQRVAGLVASGPSPEDAMVAKEGKALLQQIIDALPMQERTVFVLYEIEGLAGKEIAAALNIPEARVYRSLHSARAVVRRELTRAGLVPAQATVQRPPSPPSPPREAGAESIRESDDSSAADEAAEAFMASTLRMLTASQAMLEALMDSATALRDNLKVPAA